MIGYVDTSTLIKLLIAEPGSIEARRIWSEAEKLVSAKTVVVEAHAALGAARRAGRLSARRFGDAASSLRLIIDQIALIDITDDIIRYASSLAVSEALRGYDAIHLAAALVARIDVLTSSDIDLCAAAQRNGVHVANPTASGNVRRPAGSGSAAQPAARASASALRPAAN